MINPKKIVLSFIENYLHMGLASEMEIICILLAKLNLPNLNSLFFYNKKEVKRVNLIKRAMRPLYLQLACPHIYLFLYRSDDGV